MSYSLPTILHTDYVTGRVSRIRVNNNAIQKFYGCQSGGSNVVQQPIRSASYDIFNETRELPTAVLPTSTSVPRAPFPVGSVPYTIPRNAERIELLLEKLNQMRRIGGPAGEVDSGGERYIMDQERNLKQTFTTLREFQMASMWRGSYTYTQARMGFTHAFSGGVITVDYQMASTNQSQLDMTGAGDIIGVSWANANAPIVRDLFAINAAFINLTGRGLRDVFITSVVWGHMITNTEVQALAGNANTPVMSQERDGTTEDFTAKLVACPWITFHISDNGFDPTGSSTFEKYIEDDAAVFSADSADGQVVKYMEGGEEVMIPGTNTTEFVFGEKYYYKFVDDPVMIELHARFNGLPQLVIPDAIAYGTVVF